MKKTAIFLMLTLMLASLALAADFSAKFTVRTKDRDTDRVLREINERAKTEQGAAEVRDDLKAKLNVDQKELDFLSQQGYTLAEITYLASLVKASGQTWDKVTALKSQGVGWGVLAMRLGVKPDALRKIVVAQSKMAPEEKNETTTSTLPKARNKMMEEKREMMRQENREMKTEEKSEMMEKNEMRTNPRGY